MLFKEKIAALLKHPSLIALRMKPRPLACWASAQPWNPIPSPKSSF